MNDNYKDLSKQFPNESVLEYYKRCRVVLEERNEKLEKIVKLLLDVSWNGPIDSDHFARQKANKVLGND